MLNLAFSHTRSTVGIKAQSVQVEVHLSNGVPNFTIVGLPEAAVKESKDRVRSAIINSQFEFPCRRITVNLAPAHLPKAGSGIDLPIAIGILAASGQVPSAQLERYEFVGELALSGDLRGVNAILPCVLAAHQDQRQLIIASENAYEAALAGHDNVRSAHHLREVCQFLCQGTPLQPLPERQDADDEQHALDWSDIKGQHHAKQAMILAACGGHSLLMSGPPGSGKSMLAMRLATILPKLSETQALECAAIHSIRGQLPSFHRWKSPPFRAPHHTASPVALVGGGSPPKPGEISLAHHGVLFLDELPEFDKKVLETLREPLESGQICISRAAMQTEFPANFQLVAAMNPCPCGQYGNPHANCACSPDRINRYVGKLSAPLLDRIDMQITLKPLSNEELLRPSHESANESPTIQAQVADVRDIQIKRQGCLNANLPSKMCEQVCELGPSEQAFLASALEKLKLSARAYHRLLKVGRTIADLQGKPDVNSQMIAQALSYRQMLKAVV